MPNSVDFNGQPFHFIGIGGIGMSAIAYILAKQGYVVSGSDLTRNRVTESLEAIGVTVYQGHQADNINVEKQPQIVCSTAIATTNPEYQVAVTHHLPILHRSDILAALMGQFESIAVAGTHGKTTTSSLTGFLLLQAGLDPTIAIGGEVNAWQGNARVGQSKYFVAEADESDGTLVKFSPKIGIITNIELDHPDHYDSLESVITTFQAFAERCQVVIACIDCPNTRSHIQADLTYSLTDPQADYTVAHVTYGADGTSATILEKGLVLGEIHLQLLGEHNLSNALAAIAAARLLGAEWLPMATSLPDFLGAKRRFEVKGTFDGITFVDDYAHHPSEIRATLASAKLRRKHKVVAVFQPHRYSRTVALLDEFGLAFTDADCVVVTDIYAAGEANPTQISGEQVVQAIAATHPDVRYQPSLPDLPNFLAKILQPSDLVIFLGAGNLNQFIAPTIDTLTSCYAQAKL